MVTVIQEDPTSASGLGGNFLTKTIEFFGNNWKLMLIGVILVVTFIIIYMLLKKLEEERHEREEPGYQLFKTIKASCRLNARHDLIIKKWNPASLWLIVIPVFGWIIIPFIKKEHSAKLIDYNGKLIGYYRGEYKSMDNTINYLVYKTKLFFFFEDVFIVKVPLRLDVKHKKKDKQGKVLVDMKGKPLLEEHIINLGGMIKFLPNNDIKLYAVSLEKVGTYYYCPVFILDNDSGMLDYRQIIEGAVIDSTYQVMVQRLLNTASQAMEKGMTLNPNLKYDQMAPEKTREETKTDREAEY